MITVTAKDAKALKQLKGRAKKLGITQEQIAAAAGVTRPLVVNVFALRSKSANVVEATRRLIAQARESRNGAVAVSA